MPAVTFHTIFSNQFNTDINDLFSKKGAWNPETGVNAPLYDQQGSPELSVHGCVKNWEAGGAPPEKINIGKHHVLSPYSTHSENHILTKSFYSA